MFIHKSFRDEMYMFVDAPGIDIDEIFNDNYKIFEKNIMFKDNDIVVDIGANVGIFSILLAKQFPNIQILAFEPVPDTYKIFKENIFINKINNIIPICSAISSNHELIRITYSKLGLGGATAWSKLELPSHENVYVPSMPLDYIFSYFSIRQCKLLKIDCEGAEYEILFSSTELEKIEYLVGEFHENEILSRRGFSPDKLADYCSKHVKNMLYFEYCKMTE